VTDFVVPLPGEDVAPTGADGRALSRRGTETRRRLLDAAEKMFSELGYHDASIVKITEEAGVAQGTFYLYFGSKQDIFEDVVVDLNRRVRHAVNEEAEKGKDRLERELLGFQAYFRFTAEHPALYRVIRQAEFVSPRILGAHYERFSDGYVTGLKEAMDRGEIAKADPETLAWVLMGIAELIGMRAILWSDDGAVSKKTFAALSKIIERTLGTPGA
jgi:AcrR family transcriptional regulator